MTNEECICDSRPKAAGINATELAMADLAPRLPILEPILARKSLALFYGPRGLGKTFVALGIAWAAAAGGSFLKWRAAEPRRVLYIDGEMPAVDIRERLRLFGPPPPALDFLIADLDRGGLADLADPRAQAELWHSLRPKPLPQLVVLDNLSSLVGFAGDDAGTWRRVQRWLLAMRRSGIAVLIVHHANKKGDQRGTNHREDVLDLVLAMRRPKDYQLRQGARFELHFEKARCLYGEDADPIEAHLVQDGPGSVHWDWRPARQGQLERLAALLNSGLDPRQAAQKLGFSLAKAYRLRKRAMELSLLQVGEG